MTGGVQRIFGKEWQARPTDLVAGIVARIDDMLTDGRLGPGQRLIESDLAAEFGVGRAPLREAIRILAGDGVLELLPNRGARVRQVTRQQIGEMLNVATALVFMSLDEFVENKRFRLALRKVESRSKDIEAAMTTGDFQTLLSALRSYCLEFVAAAQNDYLVSLLARIHLNHYDLQMQRLLRFSDLAAAAAGFLALTEALRERDLDAAYRIVRQGSRRFTAQLAARGEAAASAPAPLRASP